MCNISSCFHLIGKVHVGKQKVNTLPTILVVDGEFYVIESVELFAFSEEKHIEELIVPDCFVFVDPDAFSQCNHLNKVRIGKGVQVYPYWSFPCCPIQDVSIDPKNPYIKLSDDGTMVMSKDGKHLYYYLYDIEEIVVPDGCETIGECAISYNPNLKKLVLPSSTKEFHSCCSKQMTQLDNPRRTVVSLKERSPKL